MMVENQAASPQPIMIRSVPIELSRFLKITNVVMSGGEAKSLIQSGAVRVNRQVETHRTRKLHEGDIIEVAGEMLFEVVLGER
jgi:ribosome-associated protein